MTCLFLSAVVWGSVWCPNYTDKKQLVLKKLAAASLELIYLLKWFGTLFFRSINPYRRLLLDVSIHYSIRLRRTHT